MDLIITSDDKRYSLSRFQMYIWTVTILVLWVGVSVSEGKLAKVDNTLWLLMGFNAATATAATVIATKDKSQPPDVTSAAPLAGIIGPKPSSIGSSPGPWFFRDIFLDSKDTLDLPRVQMFVWTVAILILFIVNTVKTFWPDAHGHCQLATIDEGILGLMGISQGGYIFVKAAEK